MDLDILRRRFIRMLLTLLWTVYGFAGAGAALTGQGLFSRYAMVALLCALVATASIMLWKTAVAARIVSSVGFIGAIAALFMVLQNSPLRADAYLCFIAALPVLAGWCDKRATTVALLTFFGFIGYCYVTDITLLVGPDGSTAQIMAQVFIAAVALMGASWIVSNLEIASERVDVALEDAVAARRETEKMAQAQLASAEQNRLDRRARMQEVATVFRQRVDSIIDRVAGGARQVAGTAETLTQIVDQTTQATEATMKRTSVATRNASIAAAATEEVSASAADVATGITTTAQAVRATTEQTMENARIMETLACAAESIGGVSNMIRSIAEQTNLLALNATLEAARVGHAGRGFAVVAAQVKTLAEQTEAATRSIDEQISAIQDAARAARQGSAEISEAMRQAEARSLEISAAVSQQQQATAEICQSVQASATESGEIENAIGAVGKNIERTSTAAQEMLTASDELSQETERLRREVDTLLQELAA
ncbi:MAG: methyl-accepting chemotaxis protein [Proteobacteria bacterium]|nr:methyl-accepting chemotaxis protein [Pseudomonadota bacterium]